MTHQSRLRFAILMDSTFSSFLEGFREGFHRYAKESDVEVVFFGMGGLNMTQTDDRSRASLFDLIVPEEFDGILSVSTTMANEGGVAFLAERLRSLNRMPLVSIGTSVIGEDALAIDNRSGIRAIMAHLLECHGYRKFAFVSGPSGNDEARRRREAFRGALDEAGIEQGDEWEYEGNFHVLSGHAAVREILDVRGLRPDAFVCANDLMALGVNEALSERGMRIPFDVAVTGCDDIYLERTVSHGITTVHQSFSRLSYLALERLHLMAMGKPLPDRVSVVPDLRIRSSCGCLDFRSRSCLPLWSAATTDNVDAARNAAPSGDADAARNAPSPSPECLRLSELVGKAISPSGRAELFRAWVDLIRDGFAVNRPVYELEHALSGVKALVPDSDALIQDLYAILCEECGQRAFIQNRRDLTLSRQLRSLVDRLHDEIARDITLTGHDGVFREIAELLGARRLYIIRFADYRKTGSRPALVFAGGSEIGSHGIAADAWKPEPGAWFPLDAGNLVVNLVQYEEDRFGYFLLDSDVPVASVYEYLRFRFGFISMNLFNLDRIKRLNAELTREVVTRVGAERKLKDALSLVERLSIQDDLTGLYNRRGFFMFAEQNIKYFRRQRNPFFVIYADLDGLKAINDHWGHTEGDIALRFAASAFQDAVRDSDIVARLGGDEFTMLVSKANPPDFGVIRARILDAFDQKNRELGKPWTLSASVGHYLAKEGDNRSLEEMLERADEDLYREKARKKAMR